MHTFLGHMKSILSSENSVSGCIPSVCQDASHQCIRMYPLVCQDASRQCIRMHPVGVSGCICQCFRMHLVGVSRCICQCIGMYREGSCVSGCIGKVLLL